MEQRIAEFFKANIRAILTPPTRLPVSEWAREHVRFSSETSEPGYYNPERAPYQIEILDSMSPSSPTREITMCFGSQTGKTTCEEIGMMYYIDEYPRPQAFAFSDDGELKLFIKQKFNPMLAANPSIQARLGSGMKSSSGNTLDEKQYPGGFIRFVAANVEKNLRSYSVAVMFADEIDTYPSNVQGGGDPLSLLEDRMNTFAETRKYVKSSTPANEKSHILEELSQTTYKKYNVPCPKCRKMMTFEWEYFHWDTDESGKIVKDAWMECPHCHSRIVNADKTWMMHPKHGAKWMATNMEASQERQGFYLPSFYSPVGWLSWKQIAERYVKALNAGADKRDQLIKSFFNTVLCRQYHIAMEAPDYARIMDNGKGSTYRRGEVPNDVWAITTGGDVQKNRIEVTIMGWGRRGRAYVLDHVIIPVPYGQEIDDIDSDIWNVYNESILHCQYRREDGYIIEPLAHCLDRSYKSSTIDGLYVRWMNEKFMPCRGLSKENKSGSLIPVRKESTHGLQGRVYYDVAVSDLKSVVYANLKREDDDDGTVYGCVIFPNDLYEEYYLQLTAEKLELNPKTNKTEWVKTRERNEALDCMVYNYAAMYYCQLNLLSETDVDEIVSRQKDSITRMKDVKVNTVRKRRILSRGL